MKYTRLIAMMSIASLGLLAGITGCQQDEGGSNISTPGLFIPVVPATETSTSNTTGSYYVGVGKTEGIINGELSDASGVITLPAGTWRIRYQVGGQWWQIATRSQQQACHYIGTFARISSIVVQPGTHPSLQAEGLLEAVDTTESAWQPLPNSSETWVFRDGLLAAGITPMNREEFCPIAVAPVMPVAPAGSAAPAEPATPKKTCGGVPAEGGCWYLSGVGASCQATCGANGLAVDTTLDTPSANFWSAHDLRFCQSLLTMLNCQNLPSEGVATSKGGYGMCSADSTIVLLNQGGALSTSDISKYGRIACPCK